MIINEKIKAAYNDFVKNESRLNDTRRDEVTRFADIIFGMMPSVRDIMDTEKACEKANISRDMSRLKEIKEDTSVEIVHWNYDKNVRFVKFSAHANIAQFALTLHTDEEYINIACRDANRKEYSVEIKQKGKYVTDDDIRILYNDICEGARMIDALEVFGKKLRDFVDETTKYYENLEI